MRTITIVKTWTPTSTLRLLLEVGTHKINQVLAELRRQRSVTVLQQMQPYVVFENLSHKPIDSTAHCRQQHQDIGAFLVFGRQSTFNALHLAADPLDPVEQLNLLSLGI